jgi:hypothetical protein
MSSVHQFLLCVAVPEDAIYHFEADGSDKSAAVTRDECRAIVTSLPGGHQPADSVGRPYIMFD